ncbi:phage tail tape measure protein [Pseudotabrizicola sp. 4114]|uniref:phage tail tape measure protein n=1 Tax=Pseudotabrizicola sp. 4114 TaxID=2817731 RepID=UPI002860DC6F|nr:prefoldin subunit 5 [Pseudorhodobacter sp. 4114]
MTDTYESAGTGMSAAMAKIAAPIAGIVVADMLMDIGRAARQTVGAMARVGDEAKRAGVGLEAFQEWSFVADQNRISVDSVIDAFKELSLRSDEFIQTGAGPAKESMERLGISATELKEKLKDPSALMLEIIGRLEGMDKAAQIRIADELFGGTGGERFVELLSQGEEGLRKTIERGHELGAVLDADVIAKADALDRRFGELSTTWQTLWRTGLVQAGELFGLIDRERAKLEFIPADVGRAVGNDLARQLEQQGGAGQEALGVIASVGDEYRNLGREAQTLAAALNDAATMMRGVGNEAGADALTGLAARLGDAAGAFDDGVISGGEFAGTLGEIATEADTTISAMDDLDKASLSGIIGQVSNLLSWIQELPAAVQAARAEISALEAPGVTTGTPLTGPVDGLMPPSVQLPATSPRPRKAPPMLGEPEKPKAAGGGGGGGGGRDEWGSAVEAIQRETQALQAEAAALIATAASGNRYGDAIEYARQKAELLVAAQRAGIQITPEVTAKIDALARANVTAGASAEDAAKKLQSIEDFGKNSADTMADLFTGIVTGSMTAEDALKQLIAQLIKMAAQKFFLKLFAGSFGFATGGYTGNGPLMQPAGVVHRGEFVLSARATKRLGVDNLNALHASALRGYSGGGAVGAVPKLNSDAFGSGKASSVAQTVTINAPVSVQGSSGSPEQNNDLARQIASQMENSMKLVFANELRKATRPGAVLNNRA